MPSPRLRDDGNADSFSDILGVEGWDPLAETWPIVSVGGESADRVTEKITRCEKRSFWKDIEDVAKDAKHQKHILDNHALKFLRACGEGPPGCPRVAFWDLTDDDLEVSPVVLAGRWQRSTGTTTTSRRR